MKMLFALAALLLSIQLWAVSINTATAEELSSLKGIGPALAERIIEYRKTHPFGSIEEIKKVKGIGEKTFEAIKGELNL